MEQKGLFELFFMLIMLVLLFPVATERNNIVTPNLVAQTDNFALLTDFAIADALADKSFEDCEISDVDSYREKIGDYLGNLEMYFKNAVPGASCSYGTQTYSLSGDDIFSGNIDINCSAKNSTMTVSNLTKTLYIEKKVSAIFSLGYTDPDGNVIPSSCSITVEDNLYSPSQTIVDYNLTWP